jgi:hypothetical protein
MRVMCRKLVSLVLFLALLPVPAAVVAFETDQYDLPVKPLVSLGNEVTDHVADKLREAVAKLNTEISRHERCAKGDLVSGCGSASAERSKLEFLRSQDGLARAAFDQLGTGVLAFAFTHIGRWLEKHQFSEEPARYQTSYSKSLFVFIPDVALTVSPTISMYGVELGTDKIEHLLQEGYEYYKISRRELAAGASTAEAREKAIIWGRKSERTMYGTAVSGVYSNADLAANYAGLKFYEGLTQAIAIGGVTRPAILRLDGGLWAFDEQVDLREHLLKPFISEHLNEALNPSIFSRVLYKYIRHTVRDRSCAQWFERYPGLSRSALEEKSLSLRLWDGDDYGFEDSERFVTIANTCFEDTTAAVTGDGGEGGFAKQPADCPSCDREPRQRRFTSWFAKKRTTAPATTRRPER